MWRVFEGGVDANYLRRAYEEDVVDVLGRLLEGKGHPLSRRGFA